MPLTFIPSSRAGALAVAAGLAALLSGCGGGEPPADGLKQYVGYYQEDAANNPEDPMPGTLIVNLPADTGAFEGLMPFSYIGCSGGADVGAVGGTRSASALNGSWSGTVDGVAVGGGYTGTYDGLTDQFSGSYTNAGGKVPISGPDDCHYSVAALGTWTLYGSTVSLPANFSLASTPGLAPTWSWPSLGGTVYYIVRVFDQACLAKTASNAACMMGEGQTLLTHIDYPAEFPQAKPLVAGGSYLLAVHAVDAANWHQVGFTTRVFKP